MVVIVFEARLLALAVLIILLVEAIMIIVMQ